MKAIIRLLMVVIVLLTMPWAITGCSLLQKESVPVAYVDPKTGQLVTNQVPQYGPSPAFQPALDGAGAAAGPYGPLVNLGALLAMGIAVKVLNSRELKRHINAAHPPEQK